MALSASASKEQKENRGEFERHLPGNSNVYPIDPKLNKNPLCHLSRWDMVVKRESVEHIVDFEEKYEFEEILAETQGLKIVRVRARANGARDFHFVVKIYDILGDLNRFDEIYKEFLFVRETELIEYDGIYHNNKMSKVYIVQPGYSQTLRVQMRNNGNLFNNINGDQFRKNDESRLKLFAADLLNQIWIIHRCGYVHGDIKPHNIVKRECGDDNGFIEDGWKLNNFTQMRKYKARGGYIGTPGWSAPELVIDSQKNKYSYSSDIFSFGLVILYAVNNGRHPLEITHDEKTAYGQNDDLFMSSMEKHFKNDLQCKMYQNWYYNKLLKSQNMIKNYLIQLYFDAKMSLDLFNLLHEAIFAFDSNKRWSCHQIYNSLWFSDIRRRDNKKKLHKLRISIC